MKRKMYRLLKTIFITLVCALLLSNVVAHKTYASQQQPQPGQGEQESQSTAKAPKFFVYDLKGNLIKECETKEEAEELANVEDLLYSGKTGKDGKIVIPDLITLGDVTVEDLIARGEIRIEETKVPDGYKAKETETTANIFKVREVTIENNKLIESPKPETPRPYTVPKTGVDFLSPFRQQQQQQQQQTEDECEFNSGDNTEFEKDDFTINKVDQNDNPVEGAEFKVYGKRIIITEVYLTINKEKIGEYPINDSPKVDIDTPDVNVDGPSENNNNDACRIVPRSQQQDSQVHEEPVDLEPIEYYPDDYVPEDGCTLHRDEPHNNRAYFNRKITIYLTGKDIYGNDYSAQFVADSFNISFTDLKFRPGKYTLREEKPKNPFENTSDYDRRFAAKVDTITQSYLTKYEFEIKEDGSIKVLSGPEWSWAKLDLLNESPVVEYDVEAPTDNEATVSFEGNEITIANYGLRHSVGNIVICEQQQESQVQE